MKKINLFSFAKLKVLLVLQSRISTLIFLTVSIILFAQPVNSEERLYIKVGELRAIFTDFPHRISISNPEVADVTSVTKNEVLIIGKSPGNTIINLWDKWGKQTKSIDVYLEDLSSLRGRIERLLKSAGMVEVIFNINKEENKIVLTGNIQERQKDNFDLLIGPFKDKLINLVNIDEEKASVLIDVNILELSRTALDDLGIEWPTSITATETKGPIDTAGVFADLFQIGNWTRTALNTTLNLLVKSGKGKVLSRPKLTCVSGKEAEFLVGGEVPIFTATVSTTGTFTSTVEYKEYGIILKIKPTVEDDNRGVRVAMSVEVSELGQVETTAYARAYPLTKRNASTELYLKEGQTIFLAGLLKNKDSETIRRVAGLGDIPVLGHLFRSRDFISDQTELVITLTPTIIDSESPKGLITETKTEETEKEAEENISEQKKEAILEGIAKEKTEELKDPIINYAQSVQRVINEKFFYPKEAKDRNESGTVILSLYILRDGTISEVLLARSSGYESLDKSAISLVKTIVGFQPFPNNIPLEDLWVDVPIEYHLN